MKKFVYKVMDGTKILKGVIEEVDLTAAMNTLKGRGFKIISVKEKFSLNSLSDGGKSMKAEKAATLCNQFSLILESGVSLIKGLETLINQTRNRYMKNTLISVLAQIKKGNSLGTAMKATGAFPLLLTNMVLAGELTGEVDTVFKDMEGYYLREAKISEKVKNASIYPIVILTATIGLVVFFNLFILNNLRDIFEQDPDIPTITRLFLKTVDTFTNNYMVILFLFIFIILLYFFLKRIPRVKYSMDYFKTKIPVVNVIIRDVTTSRFTRSMGIFFKAGLPMVKILENTGLIISNEYYLQGMIRANQDVLKGGKISEALVKINMFDPMVIQMLSVGEETGSLEKSFMTLSEVYDRRVETSVTRLLALVEPTFTIIIGLVVAFVVLAIALPILNMSNMF